MKEDQVKQILLEKSYITKEDLEKAEDYAKEHDISVMDYFFKENLLSNKIVGQAIAEYFKIVYADLENEKIDPKALQIIPEPIAREKKIISFFFDSNNFKLGMVNPEDIEIIHLIEKKIGHQIKPYYITEKDFQFALEFYKKSVKDKVKQILEKLDNEILEKEESDQAMVELVDLLLEYGYQKKASDVHIEPYRENIIVRFRIDGIMHQILELPKNLHDPVISRIKIMSKIRIDQHSSAQDGKLQFFSQKDRIDVRVSVVPVTEGENVVLRILSAKNRKLDLESIGFFADNLTKIKNAIDNPHGMILVTGPTGSGKSTTLYSVLKILNRPEVHVSSIEDPVEYDLEGVSQIQVNVKTGLTFSKGLRSIVRQDPDIIMIGEIRDNETASIAINSALTGHLVLSTIHTNDSPTALPRLMDMQIEPFLISSTVSVVVAQRLVRKICLKCRESYEFSEDKERSVMDQNLLKEFFKNKKIKNTNKIVFYKGVGCKDCNYTGYTGRMGIFEVLVITEQIKKLIIKKASSDEIMELARKQGMQIIMEDGLEKSLSGITSIDEVFRVSRE